MHRYWNVILWIYLWVVDLETEAALAFPSRPHHYCSVFKSGAVQLVSISVSSLLTAAAEVGFCVDLLSVRVAKFIAIRIWHVIAQYLVDLMSSNKMLWMCFFSATYHHFIPYHHPLTSWQQRHTSTAYTGQQLTQYTILLAVCVLFLSTLLYHSKCTVSSFLVIIFQYHRWYFTHSFILRKLSKFEMVHWTSQTFITQNGYFFSFFFFFKKKGMTYWS